MDYIKYNEKINKRQTENCALFIAKESHIALSMLEKLKNTLVEESLQILNVNVFEDKNTPFSQIKSAVMTFPITSEKRVVILKDDTLIKNISKVKEFEDFIKNIPEFTTLVFYFSQNPDKRTSFYKVLSKYGDIVELVKLNPYQLKDWLRNKLNRNKIKLTNDAFNYFIESSGYLNKEFDVSLSYFTNEIEKLSFVENKDNITLEIIKEIISVNVNNNIFDYINALNESNSSLAFDKLFEVKYHKIPFMQALGAVYKSIENIYVCKKASIKGLNQNEISLSYSMNPYAVSKAIENGKKYKLSELEKIIISCHKLDAYFKSGRIDEENAYILLTYGVLKRNLYDILKNEKWEVFI